jgi:hypothetical protein
MCFREGSCAFSHHDCLKAVVTQEGGQVLMFCGDADVHLSLMPPSDMVDEQAGPQFVRRDDGSR